MIEGLMCWKCGGGLDTVVQPFPRSAQCPQCTVDLHVCHMCKFFDRGAARGCREPVAEEVRDKERANFCGWFMPRPPAEVADAPAAVERAQSELESMFGLTPGSIPAATDANAARARLDALFDNGSNKT
ncbi:MAG: hypothetical protein GKR94_29585 [Gammaproteobacteria bacterium]|nr:hypothetical protein [Gammaproteobacteria bacterium]